MGRLIPPEILPLLLLVMLSGFSVLVVRSIRRRQAFLHALPINELPELTTETRLQGTLRRLFQDASAGLPLAEIGFKRNRLIFCPTDHGANAQRYKERIGKPLEVGIYGLATLKPGGIEMMQDQIFRAETYSPDTIALVHIGQLPNDYAVIGRVLSAREDRWDQMDLTVYRLRIDCADGTPLVLEAAVETMRGEERLQEQSLAHGSIRLFGYLS